MYIFLGKVELEVVGIVALIYVMYETLSIVETDVTLNEL